MNIEWEFVKKKTLWHYEKLIDKIQSVLGYPFVQEFYGHNMNEARIYAEKIRQGYLHEKETEFIDEISKNLNSLKSLGIQNYRDLIGRVATKSDCEVFIQETGYRFTALISVLNYLFRWVLPFRIPIKELLDTNPYTTETHLEIIKKRRIKSNLDVLENFRVKNSRKAFSTETGMDEAYIFDLTHRADLSRLAYVRGKTIMHLCGGGYDSLNKLANADIIKMEADMTAYYESIGKSFANFKSVIPLDWMIGGARILPKIVEDE